ncbi:hypothetical protein CIHG_03752 [Coccidioides immitis H538.4]|uniref:PBP domain-containing protein n=1 Tax=Coccidioides immitis H538.4 TaxID=396776 RepID=A0A0J8RLM6_COCIT|nr:hypothetical protein CIHG_03752 [Coccidioides immitis H538.4]
MSASLTAPWPNVSRSSTESPSPQATMLSGTISCSSDHPPTRRSSQGTATLLICSRRCMTPLKLEILNLPVRFLSRYDKSATNIKEAELWLSIGQVPWATAYSTWYHQYITFPIQALTAAILLREYTITDYGTYLSIPRGLRDQMVIYKKGTNDADDPLLNPAHLLVGARAKNAKMAKEFAKWLVSKEGGQKVIEGFKKDGQQLYSPAPYRHI